MPIIHRPVTFLQHPWSEDRIRLRLFARRRHAADKCRCSEFAIAPMFALGLHLWFPDIAP